MVDRRVIAGLAVGVVFALLAVLIVRETGNSDAQPNGRFTPKLRNSWVTRTGSTLELGSKPWRFTGVNMYWLGIDDNVVDANGPTYPTHAAVDAGFKAAAALGARVVRSTSLGVSVGSPRSLEPSLNTFNDAAFDAIDYAVADARRFGMRLMIPLTDNGHYYSGGKHNFTNWRGYTDIPGETVSDAAQRAQEAHFYTDPTVISDFHAYAAHLMNHVNPLTGLRLGTDPTIACWETGNELWDAPPSWTQQTAAYLKTLAPEALIADGSASSGTNIANTGYQQPAVDVVDAHYYPTDTPKASSDAAAVAGAGKVMVIGEYPLTGDDLTSWLGALSDDIHISGDLAWSLLPSPGGVPEPHDDGYTFHYPGADAAERAEDAALINHAAAMNTR